MAESKLAELRNMRVLLEEARVLAHNLAYHRRARLEAVLGQAIAEVDCQTEELRSERRECPRRRARPLCVSARCERETTAQPTSGYHTWAHALFRVAQDAVKEDKGRGEVGQTPGPQVIVAEGRSPVGSRPLLLLIALLPFLGQLPFYSVLR
jgi:hypothetical protein